MLLRNRDSGIGIGIGTETFTRPRPSFYKNLGLGDTLGFSELHGKQNYNKGKNQTSIF